LYTSVFGRTLSSRKLSVKKYIAAFNDVKLTDREWKSRSRSQRIYRLKSSGKECFLLFLYFQMLFTVKKALYLTIDKQMNRLKTQAKALMLRR
jgi:hypothetical protein